MGYVRRFVPMLVGCLVWSVHAGAQTTTGSITGRVIDSTSQQPIANVNITIEGTTRGTTTRSDGGFVIAGLTQGPQRVRASRIGYGAQVQAVTVTAGGSTTVQFALHTAATTLTEMVVVGYRTQRR